MAKIPYAKLPRPLIASTALVALLGGTVPATHAIRMVGEGEGYVPTVYMDPVGIPTKCFGEIELGNRKFGDRIPFEECERGLNNHLVEILKPVKKCIKNFDRFPDEAKVAIASMSYNIGNGAMCRSTIVKYFNAGNYLRGCRRMAEIYNSARGKVLKGLQIRRKKESDLCLKGFKATDGKLLEKQAAMSIDAKALAEAEVQHILNGSDVAFTTGF